MGTSPQYCVFVVIIRKWLPNDYYIQYLASSSSDIQEDPSPWCYPLPTEVWPANVSHSNEPKLNCVWAVAPLYRPFPHATGHWNPVGTFRCRFLIFSLRASASYASLCGCALECIYICTYMGRGLRST